MTYREIRYEAEGPLALVTINRPEKHNAISLATLRELQESVAAAAEHDNIKVIAITGPAGGRSRRAPTSRRFSIGISTRP